LVSTCLTVADELASSLRTGDIGPFHVGWSSSFKTRWLSLFALSIALSFVYLQFFLFSNSIRQLLFLYWPSQISFFFFIGFLFDTLVSIIQSIWCLVVLVSFHHSCLTFGI
jgi:hypothetical protein